MDKENVFITLFILLTIHIILRIKHTPRMMPECFVKCCKNKIFVEQMYRPFLNMYAVKKDNTEIMTNIVFITHPFTRDECIVQYNDAKQKGCFFLGLTSYSEFPHIVSNPYDILSNKNEKAWTDYNYCDLVDGWLYCFKNKDKYIKCSKPSVLLSESDFTNHTYLKPDPNVEKEFDFLIVCLKDNDTCSPGWQSYNRGWSMAEKFLDMICSKYKLKGLLIGRIGCKMPASCNNMMTLTDFLDYSTFIKQYNRCKFAIFFNVTDASPRCASESLVFNLPILMNEDILGGWKYIKSGVSGELFNESNFEEKLKLLLTNFSNYTPREHFINNFGIFNSGKKLKEFIKQVYKGKKLNFNIDRIEYLKPGI
jgi:hypothetical protein